MYFDKEVYISSCSVSSLQAACKNCHFLEKELQNKILILRDKDVGLIELQQLCEKMEKQLMEQVGKKMLETLSQRPPMHKKS